MMTAMTVGVMMIRIGVMIRIAEEEITISEVAGRRRNNKRSELFSRARGGFDICASRWTLVRRGAGGVQLVAVPPYNQ